MKKLPIMLCALVSMSVLPMNAMFTRVVNGTQNVARATIARVGALTAAKVTVPARAYSNQKVTETFHRYNAAKAAYLSIPESNSAARVLAECRLGVAEHAYDRARFWFEEKIKSYLTLGATALGLGGLIYGMYPTSDNDIKLAKAKLAEKQA